MNTKVLVDSGYLIHVARSRQLAVVRCDALVDHLRTPLDTIRFVLRFFALRMGPLAGLAEWLEASARACEATHPTAVAKDLRDAAQVEREDLELMRKDLERFEQVLGVARTAWLSRLPEDPRIDRHARVRRLVPARDEPLVVVAIDLELAVLGMSLGPGLVEVVRQRLPPGIDGGMFLRSRSDNAKHRAVNRSETLASVVSRQPARAHNWARVSEEVVHSYLGALEALAVANVSPVAA